MKLNSNDIEEAAINKNKIPYQQKTELKYKGEASNLLHLERA